MTHQVCPVCFGCRDPMARCFPHVFAALLFATRWAGAHASTCPPLRVADPMVVHCAAADHLDAAIGTVCNATCAAGWAPVLPPPGTTRGSRSAPGFIVECAAAAAGAEWRGVLPVCRREGACTAVSSSHTATLGLALGWESPAAWWPYGMPTHSSCAAVLPAAPTVVTCGRAGNVFLHGRLKVAGKLTIGGSTGPGADADSCEVATQAVCSGAVTAAAGIGRHAWWEFASGWEENQPPTRDMCAILHPKSLHRVVDAVASSIVLHGATVSVRGGTLRVSPAAVDADPPPSVSSVSLRFLSAHDWFETQLWVDGEPARSVDFASVVQSSTATVQCGLARGLEVFKARVDVQPGGTLTVGPAASREVCSFVACPVLPLPTVCTGQRHGDYCRLSPNTCSWPHLSNPVLMCRDDHWVLGDALPGLNATFAALYPTPDATPSQFQLRGLFDEVCFQDDAVGLDATPFPRNASLVEGVCVIDGVLRLPCERHPDPAAAPCFACDPRVAPTVWSSTCGADVCAHDALVAAEFGPLGEEGLVHLPADDPTAVRPLVGAPSCPLSHDGCPHTSTVAGVLTDATTGQPRAAVLVELENACVATSVHTADSGLFAFTVPPADYVVTVWEARDRVSRWNVTVGPSGTRQDFVAS